MLGVVFALSGTLIREHDVYARALRHVLRELVAEGAIAAEERDVDPFVERLDATFGHGGSGLERVASLLAYGTMSPATLTARFRMAAAERVPLACRTFDDVGAVLAELRAWSLPQAVLGEGWSGIDHAMARFAGFDGLVLSAEDAPGGAARSLSTLAAVAARLRLSSDRLWFVGVEPRRDIAPARAAGFQTVWLNRSGAAYPSDVAEPDQTIRSLGELLVVLSEPYMKSALTLREVYRATLEFRLGHVIPADPREV